MSCARASWGSTLTINLINETDYGVRKNYIVENFFRTRIHWYNFFSLRNRSRLLNLWSKLKHGNRGRTIFWNGGSMTYFAIGWSPALREGIQCTYTDPSEDCVIICLNSSDITHVACWVYFTIVTFGNFLEIIDGTTGNIADKSQLGTMIIDQLFLYLNIYLAYFLVSILYTWFNVLNENNHQLTQLCRCRPWRRSTELSYIGLGQCVWYIFIICMISQCILFRNTFWIYPQRSYNCKKNQW